MARDTTQPSRDRAIAYTTFMPNISFELLVLNTINGILNSSLYVGSMGDTDRSRTVFAEMIQSFDSFIFPVIDEYSRGSYDITEYKASRDRIKKEWRAALPTDLNAHVRCANELFLETTRILARQRIFKVRHFGFFSIGKKKNPHFPSTEDLMNAETEEEN